MGLEDYLICLDRFEEMKSQWRIQHTGSWVGLSAKKLDEPVFFTVKTSRMTTFDLVGRLF